MTMRIRSKMVKAYCIMSIGLACVQQSFGVTWGRHAIRGDSTVINEGPSRWIYWDIRWPSTATSFSGKLELSHKIRVWLFDQWAYLCVMFRPSLKHTEYDMTLCFMTINTVRRETHNHWRLHRFRRDWDQFRVGWKRRLGVMEPGCLRIYRSLWSCMRAEPN